MRFVRKRKDGSVVFEFTLSLCGLVALIEVAALIRNLGWF